MNCDKCKERPCDQCGKCDCVNEKWIDIKDKSPKKGMLVLFSLDGYTFLGNYNGFIDNLNKHSFSGSQTGKGTTTTLNATHWMALPKAPND